MFSKADIIFLILNKDVNIHSVSGMWWNKENSVQHVSEEYLSHLLWPDIRAEEWHGNKPPHKAPLYRNQLLLPFLRHVGTHTDLIQPVEQIIFSQISDPCARVKNTPVKSERNVARKTVPVVVVRLYTGRLIVSKQPCFIQSDRFLMLHLQSIWEIGCKN